MHFSTIPRPREDRPLWWKQWIESPLPAGSWNITGIQRSATARGLHAKGKPFSDGKWKAGWLLEILALLLVAYKSKGKIPSMQILFCVVFAVWLCKCIACILGTTAIFYMYCLIFKQTHLKSKPALYFSIYHVYMILFKLFLKNT